MSRAKTIQVEVTAVEQVTPLIKKFTLSPSESSELPPFSGGSHIIVILRRGDRTFRNPYSLMGSPRNRSSYQIAVRRDDAGRGGSVYMHEQVSVGKTLDILYPVNVFPLTHVARKHILVAGGVGITPIMAMIENLSAADGPWELHYTTRGREYVYFGRKLLEEHGECIHLYDSSNGRPDFQRILVDQPLGAHVYTCGPRGMIEAVNKAATAAGWTNSHIHSEEFAAPLVGQPFDVNLMRSELAVHVPSECSLLEAIEAVGVDPPYMCRGGVCGQCETDVLKLDGKLIHNDHWLSAEEKASGKKIMPCVSRASGQITLDR